MLMSVVFVTTRALKDLDYSIIQFYTAFFGTLSMAILNLIVLGLEVYKAYNIVNKAPELNSDGEVEELDEDAPLPKTLIETIAWPYAYDSFFVYS
jgi:hypothetical protein